MWLSGESGHGASSLISQWDSTIKSPWVCTVTSRYLSWHDLRCYQDVKQQQTDSLISQNGRPTLNPFALPVWFDTGTQWCLSQYCRPLQPTVPLRGTINPPISQSDTLSQGGTRPNMIIDAAVRTHRQVLQCCATWRSGSGHHDIPLNDIILIRN